MYPTGDDVVASPAWRMVRKVQPVARSLDAAAFYGTSGGFATFRFDPVLVPAGRGWHP